MKTELTALADQISAWLKTYTLNAKLESLVIGVSGGVDSGLVSTLCARTGLPTFVVTLPCESKPESLQNAEIQVKWLQENFPNVTRINLDLTNTFRSFATIAEQNSVQNPLGFANTKSRLRMIALYQVATVNRGLVVGTGNKVEDFGVGFFTKYGDGGVDISPIADLTKTEVRAMATALGVPQVVATAVPVDGLWADNRTDESQLGATYEELEWAIKYLGYQLSPEEQATPLSARQQEVIRVYNKWHNITAHKMAPIPTFRR